MNNNNILVLNQPIPFLPQLKLKVSLRLLRVLFLALAFSLLVFLVFQLNFQTRETYLINDYQNKIIKLSQENEKLEINFSKTNSLNNIEGYLALQNFEKAKQIRYIQILDGTVVSK